MELISTHAALVTSWKALLLVVAVPLIAWGREMVRAWQERVTVRMILTTGKPGSLVISQQDVGKKKSSLIVLVGDGDLAPAKRALEGWKP
ncbi:hypothetical protein [Lentzea sp. CA-135723]|uniref:hypothetical protein n=1 Tax=Lentzea sp. CA-135723 TaxID=3239950 RepID=UPI003D8B6AC3